MNDKPHLIAHTCCAVCLMYPLQQMSDYDTTFYFYNPNIHPRAEYERRRDELIKYANLHSIDIAIEESDNDLQAWDNAILGLENEPERGGRCSVCFEHRLLKTFQYASKVGATFVTSVMTVSPHKNSKVIEQIALSINTSFNKIKYLHIDFKKQDGFKKTSKLADAAGLYRQAYCGCRFSYPK